VTANDDRYTKECLMQLSSKGPEHFLSVLSEAVLKADEDDYSIIRPALMNLKRKYFDHRPRMESARGPIRAGQGSSLTP
jgi:hypothetical protein